MNYNICAHIGKLVFETLIFAVIARSEATWQSPGYSEMSEKRTNALTNRPELLGDCHDPLSGLVSQ